VVVSNISVVELEELFLIRSRMEGLAAYLAASKLTPGQLQQLRRLLQGMARLAKAEDTKRWLDTNENWHHLVIRASGNETLTRLLMDLWYRGMPRRIGAPKVEGHMERRYGEHLEILRAFEKRDAELAERLWREHILLGGVEITGYLRKVQAGGLAAERSG
jgi:DNA-binding GntR family transcriptional regulator